MEPRQINQSSGKRFRLKETGEIGRLEAPPLYDKPDVDDETGILWIPDFGEQAKRWVYVKAEQLEEVN